MNHNTSVDKKLIFFMLLVNSFNNQMLKKKNIWDNQFSLLKKPNMCNYLLLVFVHQGRI